MPICYNCPKKAFAIHNGIPLCEREYEEVIYNSQQQIDISPPPPMEDEEKTPVEPISPAELVDAMFDGFEFVSDTSYLNFNIPPDLCDLCSGCKCSNCAGGFNACNCKTNKAVSP